jgi:dihydrofolate reductase
VFSRTLHQSEWAHTEWAADPLVDRVTSLKKQQGRDIIAYGGARFVSALIAHGLIDEFHLFVNPTALGSGMAIFESLHSYQKMSLEFSKSFSCGVVVNQYVKSG